MEVGNLGDVQSVGDGVLERRVNLGPGYRIYFAWDGPKLIILLGGGDKSDQNSDIARAKDRWRDYQYH
jgi:putative addiction module killer protein